MEIAQTVNMETKIMQGDSHIPSAPAASINQIQNPKGQNPLRLPFASFRLIFGLEKTLPGYWRRVHKAAYAHFHREGVSQIGKQKEGIGIKRVNITVEVSLHNAFKAATAAKGVDMTTVLMEFIENYVAKYGNITPQKKGRRG